MFAVATDQSQLGDHGWLRLTSRDVSSSFQFAVLSDLVKDWIDSLTATFLESFPQSVSPHDPHVVWTWERLLLKDFSSHPDHVFAYMKASESVYKPHPQGSAEWQGAYGDHTNQWRVHACQTAAVFSPFVCASVTLPS